MALQQTATNSFIAQLPLGVHDLANDTLKMALYTGAATIGADTEQYTTTGETSGTGYAAGGVVLTNVTVAGADGEAYISFDNPSWPSSSFTCRGALVYNASKADKSIFILNFGSDKVAGPGFTVQLPTNAAGSAVLRIRTSQF